MSKNMDKMAMEIGELVKAEFVRGLMEHGGFNSPHEAYAVMKEELEEAEHHWKRMHSWFDELWAQIKANRYEAIEELASNIQKEAELLIAEAAQVAAVAKKTSMGRIERVEIDGSQCHSMQDALKLVNDKLEKDFGIKMPAHFGK